MWLLNTDHAKLTFFTGPDQVPGGYAILSHVWDADETTFQDLQALHAEGAAQTCESPHDRASAKIRESCMLAARHGHRWIWIDTCCIDKTSSAELSEAINSMFRFYALADTCYVYLRDVSTPAGWTLGGNEEEDGTLGECEPAFRKSRWHTRGWTLQELLAPRLVVFLSTDWRVLGTKSEFAELLQEITRIPVSILRCEKDITDASVAQRMSWASARRTARLEDKAYCLMGIFGINMSTLYGEGRRAFYRLQGIILSTCPDPSILAWGDCDAGWPMIYSLEPESPTLGSNNLPHAHSPEKSYLFAPSAAAFAESVDIEFMRDPPSASTGEVMIQVSQFPAFTYTPYGILMQTAVYELPLFSVAALCCVRNGRPLGLIISSCPDAIPQERDLFHCGAPGRTTARLSAIPCNVQPIRKSVLIVRQPPYRACSSLVPQSISCLNSILRPPFRIPTSIVREKWADSNVRFTFEGATAVSFKWTGYPPGPASITLFFRVSLVPRGKRGSRLLALSLGRCRLAGELASTPTAPGNHWARVDVRSPEAQDDWEAAPTSDPHSCPQDHISEVEGERTRRASIWLESGDHDSSIHVDITFSFTTCHINPTGGTLVLRTDINTP